VSFWQTMVAVHREAMRAVGGREVATAVDEAEAAPAVESPASLEQLQQQVWAS